VQGAGRGGTGHGNRDSRVAAAHGALEVAVAAAAAGCSAAA
jgi:hypothetical protein